jgi:uncharacterized protein YndB with AHSA1/START domain
MSSIRLRILVSSGIALFLVVVGALLMRDTSGPVSASAEINISAPVQRVWNIQTDFENWHMWNKDVGSMELKGPLAPGTVFNWKGGGVSISSQIQEVVPLKRIVWTGKAIGIDAVHIWELKEKDGGTHVYTRETFTGPLAWLMPGTMRKTLVSTLDNGVVQLKREAERQENTAHR